MSDLKPCPFCAGAHMFKGLKLGGLYVVWCHGCNAEITDPHSMEVAITAWNRRADDCGPLPEGPR